MVDAVVHGDKSVALLPAYAQSVAAIKAGAPVQIVHLKEGTSYYINSASFIKNAPHPNATLVLLNWLLTREGQIAVGKAMGNYGVRKDITENWLGIPELNPASFTFLEPPNNLDSSAGSKGAAFAKSIFGAQ